MVIHISEIHPIKYEKIALFSVFNFAEGLSTNTIYIDEIHYQPPTPSVFNILGGGGSFSALGARLFSTGPDSKKVGWIVDKGSDFPKEISKTIEEWRTSCLLRSDPSRLTTRGWNGFDKLENRAFHYATPKLRLDEKSLTPPLLAAKSFHLLCSPTRCINLVSAILALRKQLPSRPPRPVFIWEPVPDLMVPNEILEVTRALSHVDICSPNHTELGALMGGNGALPSGRVDKHFIESATEQLLESMPLSSFGIVVRAGADGCYIGKNGGTSRGRQTSRSKNVFSPLSPFSNRGKAKISDVTPMEPEIHTRPKPKLPARARQGLSADTDFNDLFARLERARFDSDEEEEEEDNEEPDWGTSLWIPAYHQDPSRVIDPTGGGNAFLGGLSVALARGQSLEEATRWGSIAASFAIEQVGMPTVSVDEKSGVEKWNDDIVLERLVDFKLRQGIWVDDNVIMK
jgi:sugar/nucleoside kinase (ribokinase family)